MEELYRQKTLISVSKLFEGLKPESDLRIVFNDFMNTKNGKVFVRVLLVKNLKENKAYDMLDIFEIAGGINVWLDCGRQLSKIKFNSIKKELHCLDIEAKLNKFINREGEEISYHKINYKHLTQNEKTEKRMNSLMKELREKELERVNKLAEKVNDENEELDEF